MPLLEEVGYMPTEKYARAKELLKHSRIIGEKFDLYSRALFQTETDAMRWNEEEGKWTTHTTRGDKIKSRFVIPAAGPLHRPKLLGVPGIEDFKGHAFHSSRWDFNYTGGDPSGGLDKLKDKRVGIIGTGATAVQIVPHLGEWAKELYVFQRTPSSIDVRGNRPTDEDWARKLTKGWQKKRMDNFDSLVNGGFEKEDMVGDRWTEIIRELMTAGVDPNNPVEAAAKRQIADFKKMESIRARTDLVVKDKATADALKPWYNQFCKRPCFHDEYLHTFNRPSVTLVDTKGQGVERITERGVVANGQEYELDCLIYATGFELANEWSHKTGIEIYGRDNLTITEKWKEGASTLHGWTSRGFPNCFWVSIVQAALTPNFMHVTAEQARHFAYTISECMKRDIRTVEPTQEAEEAWCDTIVKGTAIRGDFFKECTPGYYNNEGKPNKSAARNATYGYGSPAFIKILTEWREKGDLEGLDVQYNKDGQETDGKGLENAKHVDDDTETVKPTTEVELASVNGIDKEQPVTNGMDDKQPITNGTTGDQSGTKSPGVEQPAGNGTQGEKPAVNGNWLAFNETKDQRATVNGEKAAEVTVPPETEAKASTPQRKVKTLVQQYSDIQAKHQAEMNDLLAKHRGEVERLLKKHA
jgi:cation diffusion facilitator CzcD-associated flavoprotein CzcO